MSVIQSTIKVCEFPGCGRRVCARDLCYSHYEQRRAGLELYPLNLTVRKQGTPPRIVCDEVACPNPLLVGPCHVFRGRKDEDGYGVVSFRQKSVKVHKYAWEQEYGEVKDGLLVDHQCRVRACCNVDHLRVVTPQINIIENVIGHSWQIQAAKTHCDHGHPFDEGNTYVYKGGRYCRKCRARREAELRIRKRAGP